ncbi:hypothetical protein QQS21_007762 [Conoideocrella luteorostrata]|uniref:Uncharacterized protein n=1 Tax=Conoideocrella luteorostrata TaxID=1105319 RepID=A0AAJ0CMI0_9HYPO|nr:hypothetical protein QQS21_007762 [Conoideocrella luteorostrata]
MDPDGRFVTPVPPPTINGSPTIRRLGSASSLLYGRPTSQSGSVGPSWKRFFGWEANLKTERQATACISREVDISPFRFQLPDSTPHSMDERRTRDISPESLRRFLIDDPPLPPDPTMSYLSVLDIPTELAEEVDDEVDDDDDDSFATSAISETQVLRTRLSPPPCQRSVCTDLAPPSDTHSSSLTLTIRSTTDQRAIHDQTIDAPSDITQLPKLDAATDASQSNWSPTTSSSIFTTPISPQSLTDERSCFYDSNDDDDVLSSADGECLFYNPHQNMPIEEIFKGYSLPRHSGEDKAVDSSSPGKSGREPDMAISGMSFLCGPIDTGLDDFVSELGLIAEVIGSKHN